MTKNKNNKNKSSNMPFVSVCTPTFNRRPFIPFMIECFKNQDYPKSRIEWIIIDDGTDKVEDIIKEANVPQIKYFKYDNQMILGKKRNLMHEKASGSIIVYMDDDDYYPPSRISHAVEKLQNNRNALCAGSSILHVYFKHIEKIIQFGPYGPNHATAGTFAFRRQLLDITCYDESQALAEEKKFLKNYTIPFVQLDPMKTILVFSHNHNTFDKRQLLINPNPTFVKETNLKVSHFINDENTIDFIVNKIDKCIENYEPGEPKNKPEVLKQINNLSKQRQEQMKKIEEENNNQLTGVIIEDIEKKEKKNLTRLEVKNLIEQQQQLINKQHYIIEQKSNNIIELNKFISVLTEKNNLLQEV